MSAWYSSPEHGGYLTAEEAVEDLIRMRRGPVKFRHRSYVKRAKLSGFYVSSVKRGGVVVATVEANGDLMWSQS